MISLRWLRDRQPAYNCQYGPLHASTSILFLSRSVTWLFSMCGIPLVLLLSVLTLFQTHVHVGAATVQIFASDTRAIQYSSGWVGPTIFQLEPAVDDLSAAGANSSVCSIPEVSMFSPTDGQSFSFSFHGVAVQLVLSSRPDHAPFGVSIDGGPEEQRDSYSTGARCGVAWSREGLTLGNHTVRPTAHIAYPRIFLELLSIIYDDGSDIAVPPPAPPSVPSTDAKTTPTPIARPTSARPRTSTTTTTPTSQSSLASSSSASGSLSSESSSSSPADTRSAVLPTASTRNTAAHDQSSSPRRGTLTRGAVIGIATSCAGLAALLGLMVLVLLWRRRRARGSYLHPYPTSTTGSGSRTSASSVAVENLKKPLTAQRQSRAVHPSSGNSDVPLPTDAPASAPAPGTLMDMRLAPEDIDRIAARMHDVLATARLGDSGTPALLPPY
ncbi:hypothetical protein EXIGLDRAFT_131030 [Exidia glandulosa HHB12029]|uniref:Uncharacterized protein n=1 Tax=Exidia glandulosa HHB12029 TaxID=1314781 RepID=A0A166AA45_EXIGL|nr:hypothetical protein EXIGLDRAFT_131030 [Exidia glandulosa HHB12029]